jgi:hypothetical protein
MYVIIIIHKIILKSNIIYMDLNMTQYLKYSLIILAVFFVMKMFKRNNHENFTQQEPQEVVCNCNINDDLIENFSGDAAYEKFTQQEPQKICDQRKCAEDICKRANAAKYKKDTYSEFIKKNIDLSKIKYEKDKYNRIFGCQYCTNQDKNKIHQYVKTNSAPFPTDVWVESDFPYKNGIKKKWTDGYWSDGSQPTFQDMKFFCNDGSNKWKFYKTLEDCKSGKTCMPSVSEGKCNDKTGKCKNPEKNCIIRGKQIKKLLPKKIKTCVSNANIKDKKSNEEDMKVSAERGHFKCRSKSRKHEESCHRKICETVIRWNDNQENEADKINANDFYEHIKNNNNDLTRFYENCQDCVNETFVWKDSCDYATLKPSEYDKRSGLKLNLNKKQYALYKNGKNHEQLERIRKNLNELFPLTHKIQTTSKNTPEKKEIKQTVSEQCKNCAIKLCTIVKERLTENKTTNKFSFWKIYNEDKSAVKPCECNDCEITKDFVQDHLNSQCIEDLEKGHGQQDFTLHTYLSENHACCDVDSCKKYLTDNKSTIESDFKVGDTAQVILNRFASGNCSTCKNNDVIKAFINSHL